MKHKNVVKATLLLLSSLSTMCTGVVSPALPIIQRALEAQGATDIGLVVKMMVVVPNVFIAIFAPIFGYIVPKVGKLRLLFAALVVWDKAPKRITVNSRTNEIGFMDSLALYFLIRSPPRYNTAPQNLAIPQPRPGI